LATKYESMTKNWLLTGLLFLMPVFSLLAQQGGEADFMRSTGKIYVVVAAIVAIFLGIVIFLIFLERRLTKLENQTQEND
jgi:CcmD family protein